MNTRTRYFFGVFSALVMAAVFLSVVNAKPAFAAEVLVVETENVITTTGMITLTLTSPTDSQVTELESSGLYDYRMVLFGPHTGKEITNYEWRAFATVPEESYFQCQVTTSSGDYWPAEEIIISKGFHTAKLSFTPPGEGTYKISCRVWPYNPESFRDEASDSITFFLGQDAGSVYLPITIGH